MFPWLRLLGRRSERGSGGRGGGGGGEGVHVEEGSTGGPAPGFIYSTGHLVVLHSITSIPMLFFLLFYTHLLTLQLLFKNIIENYI